MNGTTTVFPVPAAIRLLLLPLPLAPLELVLQQVAESVARRRPASFARLDSHAEKVFLVDPTDLPFVFRLVPSPDRPVVQTLRR